MFLIEKCRTHLIQVKKPNSVETFAKNISAIETDKKKGHDLLFEAIEEEVSKNEAFIRE